MGIGGLSRHQLTFPIRKTFMRRSIVSLFSFLAIALIALTGCQEPQNSIPGSVDSISVRVMDSTDAKTITPEGNVNISHYVITVVNEAEGINQSSGYLTKGSMFTVSNVPAGTWYAKVDAYIDRGEDNYVKVASDQSEPKTVQAGASTTFELVLDTLDAVASGDVTVTLKMPAALSAESTAFWYQYTITGMTDEDFTHTSELLSGTTGADGLATITLDADAIGLMQGAYRFAITVQDTETSPTVTRKGVDVMRLVNGLEAKGTIDLTTYEADQSFDVTITDKIGDILTPSLEDGKEVYNLDGQDGNASLTVTLAEPLTANETIEWYVDGELDETVNADEAANGKYTLTFTPGSHIVTAIVRDTDTLMAVGSIEEFKVNLVVAEIAAQMFTFSLNSDQKSYTVTGLAQEIGEFVMPGSGVLEIPTTYQGKPVTEIGYEAFKGRTDIVGSVVIPDSVTSIGSRALSGCSSLTEINIPDNVTSIEPETFAGCSAFETVEISDASQLTSIGGYAFTGCSALTNITIPEGVTEIGDCAFTTCSVLETITIPESVTSIGTRAFYGCSSLTSVNIPDGVTEIKNSAFFGCSALETVEISDTSQLTRISWQAFRGCTALESVTIPDGVISIGDDVFHNCSALATVEITETSQLESIGDYAFADCSAIMEIKIPDGVTSIGHDAFEGCSSLKSITIPEGVTTIERGTFQGCSALAEVNPPSTLISIEGDDIYGGAFEDCSSLTSINIPESVTSIGSDAFYGCSKLETVEIPEDSQLASIGYRAFFDCSALIDINLPDGVTSIGEGAFSRCTKLASINIPDSVTSIGSTAFSYCSTLEIINIPDNVTEIGQNTFFSCSSLSDIYCEVSSQPEGWHSGWLTVCNADVFWGVPEEDFDSIMNNDSVPYDVPEPAISVDGGNVTITCEKAFAHIYYTIDGSEPTKDNGTLYKGPFAVSDGITVKAVAYVGNDIYSTVAESSGV